jgi:hypothetical protein
MRSKPRFGARLGLAVPYALEPYYAKAEARVGLNGEVANQRKPFTSGDQYQKPLAYNPISEHIKTGMTALGMPFYRTPLAVITQDHAPSGRKGPQPGDAAKTAYVNRYGDPMGSNPPPGCRCSVRSRTCRTSRCCPIAPSPICRPTAPGQSGALPGTRRHTASGFRPHRHRRMFRDRERAAAQAIGADRPTGFGPRINQDGNGMLGAYFLTHCFGGASALVPSSERYDKSETLTATFATDFCHSDEFLACSVSGPAR